MMPGSYGPQEPPEHPPGCNDNCPGGLCDSCYQQPPEDEETQPSEDEETQPSVEAVVARGLNDICMHLIRRGEHPPPGSGGIWMEFFQRLAYGEDRDKWPDELGPRALETARAYLVRAPREPDDQLEQRVRAMLQRYRR